MNNRRKEQAGSRACLASPGRQRRQRLFQSNLSRQNHRECLVCVDDSLVKHTRSRLDKSSKDLPRLAVEVGKAAGPVRKKVPAVPPQPAKKGKKEAAATQAAEEVQVLITCGPLDLEEVEGIQEEVGECRIRCWVPNSSECKSKALPTANPAPKEVAVAVKEVVDRKRPVVAGFAKQIQGKVDAAGNGLASQAVVVGTAAALPAAVLPRYVATSVGHAFAGSCRLLASCVCHQRLAPRQTRKIRSSIAVRFLRLTRVRGIAKSRNESYLAGLKEDITGGKTHEKPYSNV